MKRILVRTLFIASVLGTFGVVKATAEDAQRDAVARYAFDDGQGDVLHDRSGHGHHGRIEGAYWNRRGNIPCLVFDGAGDFVELGDVPGFHAPADFTILAWVRLEASPYPDETTNWTLIDCEAYRKSGYLLRIDGAASKATFRSSQNGDDQYGMGMTPLENGGTYFIAACRRGDQASLYVNGKLDAQFVMNQPADGDVPLRISAAGQSFEGAMFEVSLFDRALRPDEVIEAYWRGAERYEPANARGTLQLTPYIYEQEHEAFAEVDYFGVLPLQPDEAVSVNLLRNDGGVIASETLPPDAGMGRAEVRFDLSNAPKGEYIMRAELKSGTRSAQTKEPFDYPPARKTPPSPAELIVESLPKPRPTPAFRTAGTPGGGFVLADNDREYRVESSFSVPGDGWNALDVGEINAASEWRIKVADSAAVEATGKTYALSRRLRIESERILVLDTIRNTTDAPLGLLVRHRLEVEPDADTAIYIGGRRVAGDVAPRGINRSPTLFAGRPGEGIGLVPVDDVFLVQSRGGYDAQGRLELSTAEFALDAGASYTLEWAIYINGTGDYFDLVNAIRRTEGRNNVRIEGTLTPLQGTQQRRDVSLVPDVEYFALRNARYATIFCLSWCTDDPAISVEGIEFIAYPQERQRIREMMEKLAEVRPDVIGMFHVAHQLYATNKPDQRWPDSRVLDASGKQATYPYNYENGNYFSRERYEDNWRWWIFYPTLDNSFGKALLDSVDVMMDEMKCRGVFADGFLWGYGGEYTYDRWDGHSADIDPDTHQILRKKGSVLLLTQDAMIAWCRKIWDKGGVVIANGVTPTRTICALPLLMDKEVTEGPDVPLLPTPITLGNPDLCKTEAGVYQDVLNKLRCGNLYTYYNEPVKLSHASLPQQMYPITVQEVHAGCIRGKERIVTMNSGIYGWPESRDLHFVYHFDSRGRRVPHDFPTTVDAESVRTRLDLKRDATAAIVRIPVQIQSDTPVNVLVKEYDGRRLSMLLNGKGDIGISLPDGTTLPLRIDGVANFTWPIN